MSGKKRYGDPRKNEELAVSKQAAGRSKRELSVGFIFIAWIVFFALWLTVGLIVAAIVFGVLLIGGGAVLAAS